MPRCQMLVMIAAALLIGPACTAAGNAAAAAPDAGAEARDATAEEFPEVYQWSVPVPGGGNAWAFLWVPPEADRIRGVLVGGRTLMEPEFAADPLIRAACAEQKLAIVYFNPSIGATFEFWQGDIADRFQQTLDDLAETSGYGEIAVAPLFPFGHSVGAIFSSRVARWAPQRTFGVLIFKAGVVPVPGHVDAPITRIPLVQVQGQFEEFGRDNESREGGWQAGRRNLSRWRDQDDNYLVSLLVEVGGTHFAWNRPVAEHIALYLRDVAAMRLEDWPIDAEQPIELDWVAPEDGYLSSIHVERRDRPRAAPYAEFEGEPSEAFWHPSLRVAQSTDARHDEIYAKKPQFVTFVHPESENVIHPGHDLRLRMGAHWVGPDEFQVAGRFLDEAPRGYDPVDGPAGHGEGSVRFRRFGGSVEQVGEDRFRVVLDPRRAMQADILVYHPGDDEYRYAEQQGRIGLSGRLTAGEAQRIRFDPPAEVAAADLPLSLDAESTSDLPVRYAIIHGPAVIEDGKLHLSDVPARAAEVLEIRLIAYQWGSMTEPRIQSAEPIERTIRVRR